MTTWYYARNGQQFGPHTEEELKQFIAEGKLGSDELIWKAGLPNWVQAHTVFAPPLPAGGPPPPPPPPAAHGWPPPQHAPQANPMQPHFGAPQQGQPQYSAQPQRKERVAYVLLGVFLGVLGVHNFYAGYTGRGVAQLLVTLFLGWLVVPAIGIWIWNIVEVITVTSDAKGVPFS